MFLTLSGPSKSAVVLEVWGTDSRVSPAGVPTCPRPQKPLGQRAAYHRVQAWAGPAPGSADPWPDLSDGRGRVPPRRPGASAQGRVLLSSKSVGTAARGAVSFPCHWGRHRVGSGVAMAGPRPSWRLGPSRGPPLRGAGRLSRAACAGNRRQSPRVPGPWPCKDA